MMKILLIANYTELPRDFFIYKKTVFYKNKYKICKIDKEKILFTEKKTLVNIISLKKHFLYYISDSILYKHNLISNNIVKTLLPKKSKLQIKIIQKDKYIIRYKLLDNDWKIRCLDLFGSVIWETENAEPFNSKLIGDNFIVDFIRQKKLGLFDFNNNPIWQYNYTDLLGLENPDIVGLYSDIIKINNDIYLYLAGRDKNGEKQGTFCIDLETGKINHIYNNIIGYSFQENKLLYNIHNNKLNILNTTTQEIKTIDFSNELKKHNIFPDSKFVVQNGLIYFKQSTGDVIARIGILDPKTAKLIWKYDFPKGSGGVGSLKVKNNRIYAHTQDGTLYIFEKEK